MVQVLQPKGQLVHAHQPTKSTTTHTFPTHTILATPPKLVTHKSLWMRKLGEHLCLPHTSRAPLQSGTVPRTKAYHVWRTHLDTCRAFTRVTLEIMACAIRFLRHEVVILRKMARTICNILLEMILFLLRSPCALRWRSCFVLCLVVVCSCVLYFWYMHCNALRRTTTHCNTLQHSATYCNTLAQRHALLLEHATHRNTLKHTAIYFKTLHMLLLEQVTHCNTLQHTATHYNTLKYTAIHCNTLQYTAIHCNTLQHTCLTRRIATRTSYTLQRTAIHCNTSNTPARHHTLLLEFMQTYDIHVRSMCA